MWRKAASLVRKGLFSVGKPLKMPSLSPTMTQGTIAQWKVAEGDKIEEGDALVDIETDKATMALESQETGVLAQIVVPNGSKDVNVGAVIAYTVKNAEELKKFTPRDASAAASPSPATQAPPPTAPQSPQRSSSPGKEYPPHKLVGLPALSPTMTSGNIVSYEVKVGDAISQGDSICSIETDKATVTFDYQDEGFLAKVLVPAGSKDVAIGTPLVVAVKKKEWVAAFDDFILEETKSAGNAEANARAKSTSAPAQPQSSTAPAATAPTASSQSRAAPTPAGSTAPSGRQSMSPAARTALKNGGVDLSQPQPLPPGSGPQGRLILQDAQAFLASRAAGSPATTPQTETAPAGYEEIPVSGMRRVIAERLLHSKQTIPHFYLSADVRMDGLLALKRQIAEQGGTRVSVTDMLIKAIGLASAEVPEANAQLDGDRLRRFADCDVSLAVDIGDGLITPIIRAANTKSLAAISREAADLVARAKAKKLAPQEFQGGTFSLSNLGMMGVKHFAAVINPPQACILAVGATEKRAVFVADAPSQLRWEQTMTVTLSADHRVVDGAVGARWLQAFRKHVESPFLLLL